MQMTKLLEKYCQCSVCGSKAMLIVKSELKDDCIEYRTTCLDCGDITFDTFNTFEYCEECGNELPKAVREEREGGYFELITVCPYCGATYTGGA